MGDCLDTPPVLSDIASKDTNRIVGRIAESLTANSVFINLLDGGVFPAGTSDAQRSVVQMPAAPAIRSPSRRSSTTRKSAARLARRN